MPLRPRWRVTWRLLLTLGLVAGVASVWLCLDADAAARRAVLPPNVGNFDAVVRRLAPCPADGRYAFAVLGDSHNRGTYGDLMQDLKTRPLAFLVHLGDFVQSPRLPEHRFFTLKMAGELRTPFPVFLVAGNHDLWNGFSAADFVRRYGPLDTFFRYGPDLFILLPFAAEGQTAPHVAFLEQVLERERPTARYVFVLTHAPPILPPLVEVRSAQREVGSEKESQTLRTSHYALRTSESENRALSGDAYWPGLASLLEKHRVTYVIAGHIHGYADFERGGVHYLVSGGGGGGFNPHYVVERLHHAVILDVGPEGIVQHVVPAGPARRYLEYHLEVWAVDFPGPYLRRYWPIPLAAGLLYLVLVIFAWHGLFHRRRPLSGGPS